MFAIKDKQVFAYRISTHRNVEDWRKEPSADDERRWAVHCLDHNQRTFFATYTKAKEWAALPQACPVCLTFDQRCIYCPSNIDQWRLDPKIGFTPSAGHIMGNAVCPHHKYGRIPEGIDYLEVRDVVLDKPLVEIFIGAAFTGTKVFTISFQSGDQAYWLRSHLSFGCMTRKNAGEYREALSFGLTVASHLEASLESRTDVNRVTYSFETWEQAQARQTNK